MQKYKKYCFTTLFNTLNNIEHCIFNVILRNFASPLWVFTMTDEHFHTTDIHVGLTPEQVLESRQKYGENILTPPRRTSLWKLYLDKYRDPIIQILLVAAAISLALAFVEGEFIETIGIFIAIFLATTIGFYFECDATKKFRVLTAMSEEQPVRVRRNGRVTQIARRDVVVGDIVLIETGDEVPADGVLLTAASLQIDESSLTGEQLTSKFPVSENKPSDSAYPSYKVLRSTMVMNGNGVMCVSSVGDATEIGHVATKSTEVTNVKTPLNQQLDRLASLISRIGSGVAVAAFLIFLVHDIIVNDAVWRGSDYMRMAEVVLQYFMMAVTLIVMAVPEGLPMAVTLALALNMRRMLRSNNLVRKLHACETMGAVTVICTDKTGTLTQNKMIVGEMARSRDCDDERLFLNIACNSTAHLDGDKGVGNPTEVALLRWLNGQGEDYLQLRSGASVTKRMPFSTETKYMMTVIDGRLLLVKGAPEKVLAMCNISADDRHEIEEKLSAYQRKGFRTLAFASLQADDFKSSGLHFDAITAIEDPVRPDVPAAVKRCQDAGIEVKIVTGDTSATASEIGRQVGVADPDHDSSDAYITGAEWEALSDEEAMRRAPMIKVMSRARPADKQRLVEMLQRSSEVVAVTGDGTNDAPALHYAHVGLSLGSGTSVAKEASDMTLLDDSFASIANAVMWGRSLYKNIQRFLYYQLVVNVTALLLVLGGSVIGTEMPLTVTQILWVNLIMDTFAAMALASLPPSRSVMREKPRRQGEFIITPHIGKLILLSGLTFFAVMFVFLIWCEYHNSGGVDRHELTLFFTTFVMIQFWNLFNAKALGSHHSAFHNLRGDGSMLLVMLLILVGQVLIVEFGGDMFRTEPLSLREWVIITAATSVVLWVGELIRLIKK